MQTSAYKTFVIILYTYFNFIIRAWKIALAKAAKNFYSQSGDIWKYIKFNARVAPINPPRLVHISDPNYGSTFVLNKRIYNNFLYITCNAHTHQYSNMPDIKFNLTRVYQKK